MSTYRMLAAAMFVLLITGCSATMPQMQAMDSPQPEAVPAGKTRIVFMRSTFVGSLINASLYDVTKGEPVFLGFIPNGSRIVYDIEPGQHFFMVQSEAADFLKADMTAGKTYYALVTPRFGTVAARFSLAPVRADGTVPGNTDPVRIQDMKSKTKVLTNTSETKDWFQANLADIKTKQAQYWAAWQRKPPADMAQATLNANDGQ